jgi:hypothetical protein
MFHMFTFVCYDLKVLQYHHIYNRCFSGYVSYMMYKHVNICLCTKFHMSGYNGLLVIAISFHFIFIHPIDQYIDIGNVKS